MFDIILVCFGIGVVGLVVSSATASAHEFGHSGGHNGAVAAFVVVLGLPILASLAGGVAAIRYHNHRGETTGRASSTVVGLLFVGLGAAILLPAVAGHP